MFLNNTVASATEHTCSRTSVQLWKPKSLLSTAVWYPQRINIRVLLHAKKICNLSYPLYSLLPLASYFMLLEHCFQPAEELCVSVMPEPQGCLGWECHFPGRCCDWLSLSSRFPGTSLSCFHFAQIAPDYAELPSFSCLLWSRPAIHRCG